MRFRFITLSALISMLICTLTSALICALTPSLAHAQSTPFTLSHSEPALEVRLLQSEGASLAVLHQHHAPHSAEREAVFTELASLAGGCRVRLYWGDERPPSSDLELSPLSPLASRSALVSLKDALQQNDPISKGARGATLTISTQGPLNLRGAYSAGCALPDQPTSKSKKRARKRPLLRAQARHQNNTRAPTPHWRPLSLKLNTTRRALVLSDEGFSVGLSWGRGLSVEPSSKAQAEPSTQGLTWRDLREGSLVSLKVSLLSAHTPLTPLTQEDLALQKKTKTSPPLICALPHADRPLKLPCEALEGLLRFLSYQEGIYEGLGEGVTRRGAPALLAAHLIAPALPVSWSLYALEGASRDGLSWPKWHRDPLEYTDGRFATLPMLEATLKRLSPQEAEERLKRSLGWRLWGSMFTEHIRGLTRLAMSFANRPKRDLLLQERLTPKSTQRGLINNAILMPWALDAASRLLKNETYAGLLGATPGERGRLERLKKPWSTRVWGFFERRVNIAQLNARLPLWGRTLPAPAEGLEEPWLRFKSHLGLSVSALSKSADLLASDLLVSLEGVVAYPTQERVERLIHLGLPYPAGHLTPQGATHLHTLTLTDPPQDQKALNTSSSPLMTRPSLWLDALLQRAMSAQRARYWPVKLTLALEELQGRHWAQMSARSLLTLAGEVNQAQPTLKSLARPFIKQGQHPTLDRRGWSLKSCVALTLSEPPPLADFGKVHSSELK